MFGEQAFSFTGPKQWNSLPYDIRHSPSLFSFKKALLNYHTMDDRTNKAHHNYHTMDDCTNKAHHNNHTLDNCTNKAHHNCHTLDNCTNKAHHNYHTLDNCTIIQSAAGGKVDSPETTNCTSLHKHIIK